LSSLVHKQKRLGRDGFCDHNGRRGWGCAKSERKVVAKLGDKTRNSERAWKKNDEKERKKKKVEGNVN